MKLSQLMKRVKTNSIYADCEISFVTDNFEKIEENCLFVCINGHKTDAHIFADKAIGERIIWRATIKSANCR